ncbi:hypothetical protein [Leminorella grimontii]|uniref:hypothetical protein n=1 Tax=Leminorella grimontii TaxID=82981 RepID=UPI00321FB725
MSLSEQLTAYSRLASVSEAELESISETQYDAVCTILDGISTVGNLVFLAASGSGYPEEQAKKDMSKLGAFLSTLAEIADVLNRNSSAAGGEIVCRQRRVTNE